MKDRDLTQEQRAALHILNILKRDVDLAIANLINCKADYAKTTTTRRLWQQEQDKDGGPIGFDPCLNNWDACEKTDRARITEANKRLEFAQMVYSYATETFIIKRR
jgi:hypothetical protein